jgi:cob(I)alamin adenosyltransferase
VARISTGTGDDGTTGLASGGRVPKASARVALVGAIDEANDALGLAAALATRADLRALVQGLQEDLFTLGAEVMGARDVHVGAERVARVEGEEDRLEAALPPLTRFILPGGTPCAAALQLARSVARRAEREAWKAHAENPLGADALRYLNRLSDLLFLLAREENVKAGVEDRQWVGRSRKE